MSIANLDFSIKKNNDLYKIWKGYMKNKHLQEYVNVELEKIRAQVEIPGFRKGKADISIIREKYNSRAFYESVNEIIMNLINKEIMPKEKYDLISRPDIKFQIALDSKKDLDFHIYFFLKPDLTKFEPAKISISQNVVKLSDSDFQKEIDIYLAKNVNFEENRDSNYKVKNGDKVKIFFDGFLEKENKPIDGGKAEEYDLVIGSKSFIDTFEEQIIGHKIGDEFKVNVKFPEIYQQNKELENQPAFFDVKILKIFESKPGELNESFVKNNGAESVEKFKETFKSNILKSYESFEKARLKDEIIQLAIKKTDIEVSEEFLEREIEVKLEKKKENLQEGEVFDEKTFKKEQKEISRKSLEIYYLIQGISKKKGFFASENEVKAYLIRYAINSGVEDVQSFLKEMEKTPEVKNNVESAIIEEKVYLYLFEEITKKNNEISKEKFDKMIHEYYENQRKKK